MSEVDDRIPEDFAGDSRECSNPYLISFVTKESEDQIRPEPCYAVQEMRGMDTINVNLHEAIDSHSYRPRAWLSE